MARAGVRRGDAGIGQREGEQLRKEGSGQKPPAITCPTGFSYSNNYQITRSQAGP